MTAISTGDMARFFQLGNDNARLRADIQRLTGELASGERSDLRSAVSGDFGALGSIERSLTTVAAYRLAADETTLLLSAGQTALETVRSNLTSLSPALVVTDENAQPAQVEALGRDARARFASVVSALNVTVADRAVFAGAAIGGPALAPAEEMLDALALATSGALTAEEVTLAVETWFAPGGGFETDGYVGSANPISAITVAEGETLQPTLTAADTDLREALAGMALAALLDRNVLAGQTDQRGRLAREAGERLIEADPGLVARQGEIGTLENRLDAARSRNLAEESGLEIARSEIVAIDPFRAASELRAVEIQLETLYTVTVRLSQLTLTEFLR